MLNRRSLLAGACAAALLGTPLNARPIHGGAALGGGGGLPNLVATVTFPGGSPAGGPFTYDIANGTDMGSYVAPTAGFTQRCIRVRNAGLANFFVDFRPDVSGGRIEVVFWNGETLGTVTTKTFRNLPAYTVVVTLSGATQSDWRSVSSWSIPYHYWGNRWRWQSSLRPTNVRTAAQIFSQSLLPTMSLTAARESGYSGVIVPTAPTLPTSSSGDGKNGNLTAMTSGTAYGYTGYIYLPFMIGDDGTNRLWGIDSAGDDGGYRDEEGVTTKWQADWLLNGTASSLNTFMQQAEYFSCQANALYAPDATSGAGGPVNQKADVTRYAASVFYGYGSYYQTMNGGSSGQASGAFAGSVSGTTLSVYSSPNLISGTLLQAGMVLKSNVNSGRTYGTAAGVITPGTTILSQLTGSPGDVGTYQLSNSMSVVAAVSITSISYNSSTGLVTVTLSGASGINPGNFFGIQVGSGTGSYTSLNGLFGAGSGTTGSTVTYTIATGLTLTASGGATCPLNMRCPATTGEYQSKGDEHSPQVWYVPYLITEDPFYIEGAQYHETFALQADILYKEGIIGNLTTDPTGASGINGAFTLAPALPSTAEERGIGWSSMNIAKCWVMSPTSAPSWLLPKSVWAAYSSDTSKFIDYIQAASPTDQFFTVFHSVAFNTSGDTPQTFYKAYVAQGFGVATLVGLPVPAAAGKSAPSSWFNQLTYMFDFLRQTIDPALASGFNTQSPVIHDLGAGLYTNLNPTSGCTIGTATVPPSGSNCLNTYAGLETYSGPYNRDSSPYPSNPDPGYIGQNPANLGPTRAGAAIAKTVGITGAAAVLTRMDAMIDFSFPQALYGIPFQPQDGFTGT